MNNSMIAHLWANEKKESARGSNFFFEGKSIYSYGYHFEAGRIVRNKRGEKAYLLNGEYYSSSRCKHQHCVRSAIPTGSKVFYVGYNMSNTGNMTFVTSKLESIKKAIGKYQKARTRLFYQDIWGVFRSIINYIEFFGMGTPKSLIKKSANDWLGAKHELSWSPDKVKREYVRELKHIFQVLLDYQSLEVLGTVNVVVDEICGEGTWNRYTIRCQKWANGLGGRRREVRERRQRECDARNKTLEEQVQMWKSSEISQIYCNGIYFDNGQPNAWLRVKNGIIETSKNIKIGRTEAERLWKLIKFFHNGGKFQHDMVLDTIGHKWKINSYKNDMLTAGCHRIAYNEMESIAKQLGWG